MNDLVSIVMPTYNTAEYITESILSVILQTYQNWELIIVDDCSTDETEKIVNEFSDSRITFHKNECNLGAAASRNKALSLAKGKWIAFLDSDDLWLPNKLEKQINFMKSNEYHFSYTEYMEIDEHGKATGNIVSGPKRVTYSGIKRYCWPGCLTVMYDADMIGTIQIKDIKKNNDYAMWLKVSQKADCFLLKDVLAKYRKGRKGSISTNGYMTMIMWQYKLFRQAEGENVITSCLYTLRNICYGVLKKVFFIRRNI